MERQVTGPQNSGVVVYRPPSVEEIKAYAEVDSETLVRKLREDRYLARVVGAVMKAVEDVPTERLETVFRDPEKLRELLGRVTADRELRHRHDYFAKLGGITSGIMDKLEGTLGRIRDSTGQVEAGIPEYNQAWQRIMRGLSSQEIDERRSDLEARLADEAPAEMKVAVARLDDGAKLMGFLSLILWDQLKGGQTPMSTLSGMAKVVNVNRMVDEALEFRSILSYDFSNPEEADRLIREKGSRVDISSEYGARIQRADDLRIKASGEVSGAEIMVKRSYSEDVPLVGGHSAQIRQMVSNIVANAERMGATRINVSTSLENDAELGDCVAIRIGDNGAGISPEDLGRVFHRYFGTGRDESRTYLGLTVARRIAENHGGYIDVESNGYRNHNCSVRSLGYGEREIDEGALVTVKIPTNGSSMTPREYGRLKPPQQKAFVDGMRIPEQRRPPEEYMGLSEDEVLRVLESRPQIASMISPLVGVLEHMAPDERAAAESLTDPYRLRDISVELFIDDELRRRIDLYATLGERLGGAAHELKNQLFVIVGSTMTLRSLAETGTSDSSSITDMLGGVQAGIPDMREILEVFSEEQRTEPREMIQVNLKDVVASKVRAYNLTSGNVSRGEIRIDTNLGEVSDSDVTVEGYRGRIGQVLSNMIPNAEHAIVEYRDRERGENQEPEQGVIQVRLRRITDPELGECVAVDVSDNGCGIAPENFSKLFQKYFTTKKASGKGSGLGLSTCMEVAQEHGGYIDVESNGLRIHRGEIIQLQEGEREVTGGGARFTTVLPVRHRDEMLGTAEIEGNL